MNERTEGIEYPSESTERESTERESVALKSTELVSIEEEACSSADLDTLMINHFNGRIVRKDLTKQLKEGANVPVYVLEYLLGIYCASDDDEIVEQGLKSVKAILTDNYVRPDEAEKVKSLIRESGTYKVIDKVSVTLNQRKDLYEASLSNLGIRDAQIESATVIQNEKLLTGGIWCILTMQYLYDECVPGNSPFSILSLKAIQMPNMNLDEIMTARSAFTTDQWRDLLLRSTGMEPRNLEIRAKQHLLARLIPFVENNYNVCELGPRGTGKSHVYKECSPNSLLVSGGQTTVANLFYNMTTRKVGLVGLWDVVAFDEVAGINLKDRDGIQIMKDYMASGSFSRGRESIEAKASMVFVGNINQSVDTLVKTSHLFAPFPAGMIDTAFFDRFHAYIPGWEIPKMRPEYFTDSYGLITDYLAEYMREMRKYNFADAIDRYFKLGNHLNQRDVIAVRKTTSGLLKLLHPDGQYDKEDVRDCLTYAIEQRRRVKEQLKKLGGMEFFDVNLSYIDNETLDEIMVAVPEQGGDQIIPQGPMKPGVLYTITRGTAGQIGLYRYETQMISGSGKHTVSGIGNNSSAKELVRIGFDYLKGNLNRISSLSKFSENDFHLHIVEHHNSGSSASSLSALIAFCSVLLDKPVLDSLVILGDMTLGGVVNPVESLADSMQMALDAGARKILIPMSSISDINTVPPEIFSKFQVNFYTDPIDAVFKALGQS